MYKTTTGLILRETSYKNSSKILTVLTDRAGKLTVSARGARRKNSRIAAVSQLLAFSELTLYGTRGRWYLNEGNTIELFAGLRTDITRFSLGAYFAQLLEVVSDEDIPNVEILRLGLNSLFALSEGKKDERLIKAAFELRLMCLSGYEPQLTYCAACGDASPERLLFDVFSGTLICGKCASEQGCKSEWLCTASLAAMRYITKSDGGKVFSFTLSQEALQKLSAATETYVQAQLERKFKTLEFYKKLAE